MLKAFDSSRKGERPPNRSRQTVIVFGRGAPAIQYACRANTSMQSLMYPVTRKGCAERKESTIEMEYVSSSQLPTQCVVHRSIYRTD